MRGFVLSSAEFPNWRTNRVERFGWFCLGRRNRLRFRSFRFGDRYYRYGFEVDDGVIRAEWLYRTARRETRLFMRQEDQFELSGPFVKEGRGLESRTRNNALFLSVVAQFNGAIAIDILNWFRTKLNIISGLEDIGYRDATLQRFEDDADFRQRVLDFIRLADVGVTDITVGHNLCGMLLAA